MEPTLPKSVTSIHIEDEMKGAYLDYAMSVIVGRALPDVRDGLKPVHRRVLYAMSELGNAYNKAYKKSARVVGDVIGKYHPHGDSAVYDTMVRMAQPFSLRYPLVDGQGNFGSIDGDNAAAMRYTEVRMEKITQELLQDLEKDTVDFGPNYDDSLKEPLVFPTKIPNLLINGSSGIAVGMATNIPPHNISEVLNGCVALIENPEITIDELMTYIPGPDFPTSGVIHGSRGIHTGYKEGRGVVHVRAVAEIEVGKNDRESIIITELPYQVNKARLIEQIANLVRNKSLTGISDLRDESDRKGIRVVIELKKGEIANVILNRLYKHTQMETSFGINMLALHNNQPKLLNLKEILVAFVDHRRDVVTRRTIFELKKAQARAHILEGLVKALENLDDVIRRIRAAKGPSEAKQDLISAHGFSNEQAQAILDMRLQRLTGLEREKILQEHKEVLALIEELRKILSSETILMEVIKSELLEILEKYSDERRTQIIQNAEEINIQDMIADEEMLVTITHSGYIKRLAPKTFRTQGRGGKGLKGTTTSEEDWVTHLFTASTHETVLVFTDTAKVYKMKVYEIPEASRTAKGKAIVNLLNLSAGEKVRAILPIRDLSKNTFVVMVTKNGVIKKSELIAYKNIRTAGIIALNIREGDELLDVKLCEENQEIFLTSKNGLAIRFNEKDARAMGRTAAGVKGMTLSKGDEVVSMEVLDGAPHILTVTSKGYGKRTPVEEYRSQTRGGKGIITLKTTSKVGCVIASLKVNEKDDLMLVTDRGQVIRTSVEEISVIGRATQGVRVLNVSEGEQVVGAELILNHSESDE